MKLLFFISGYDGCGYYRVQLIAKYLNKFPEVHAKIASQYSKVDIDWSDILILQKQVNQKALPYVNYAKSKGKKIVCEVDDDYFNIPSWNPAYKHFQGRGEELVNFYKMADAMTVTTDHLKKEMSKYNPNVNVLANSLDISYLDKIKDLTKEEKYAHLKYLTNDRKSIETEEAEKMMEGKTIIGWGGSPSHLRDLQQATPALIKLCKENKEVMLIMMACSTDELMDSIPKEQMLVVNPVPIFLYPKNLHVQKWDIGICPIEDNTFNRSKSNLKYLEFSYNKFACVCSNVENYANTVTHQENGILSDNDTESWYTNLIDLIKNKEVRDNMSTSAEKFIRDKFDIRDNITGWYDLYQSLLG